MIALNLIVMPTFTIIGIILGGGGENKKGIADPKATIFKKKSKQKNNTESGGNKIKKS